MSGPQGRFMSPDPSGLGVTITNPQSWNKYAYVRNKPLTLADKNGLYPTAVHNEIDRRAFASLSPTDLVLVADGQGEEHAIVPASFRYVLKRVPGSEHEVDGLDQEGLAGVAGAPEDVQSSRERELGGLFTRTEKPNEAEPQCLERHLE